VQVVRGHVIETLPVKLGLTSGARTEIMRGLQKGDIIVANAGTSLRDGDRVYGVFAGDLAGLVNRQTGKR
jgi:type II secretory pathway component PulC